MEVNWLHIKETRQCPRQISEGLGQEKQEEDQEIYWENQ